jgi:phage shock protein C
MGAMYCTQCGLELSEGTRFCPSCGRSVDPAVNSGDSGEGAIPRARRILSRPMNEKRIGGVCAAFARYLDIDLTLVRVLWVFAVLFGGTGLIAYIICWAVLPKDYGTVIPGSVPGHVI